MLVSVIYEPVPSQPWRKKKFHEVRCDLSGCERSWHVPYRGNRAEDKLDFCCVEHKHSARCLGESFDKKLKELSQRRWGVPSAACLDETKRKRALTNEIRWGDKNYNNREKAKKTCQEKMGCSNPFQSDGVKEKIRVSLIERWGVTSPIHSPEIRRKIEDTLLQNWGVSHAWNMPKHRERNKSREVREKIHQTMKMRGRYGKSRVEDLMFGDLCRVYGCESVERQVLLNGWSMDFRVRDVYIQLDGVYWHGLDRPIEELIASQRPRDKIILGTLLRDSEQNMWCHSMGIQLIRITDSEFMEAGLSTIVEKMKEFE